MNPLLLIGILAGGFVFRALRRSDKKDLDKSPAESDTDTVVAIVSDYDEAPDNSGSDDIGSVGADPAPPSDS